MKRLIAVLAMVFFAVAVAPAQAVFYYDPPFPAPAPTPSHQCHASFYGTAEAGYYSPMTGGNMVYWAAQDTALDAYVTGQIGSHSYGCGGIIHVAGDGTRDTWGYWYNPTQRWYVACHVFAAPTATNGMPNLTAQCTGWAPY